MSALSGFLVFLKCLTCPRGELGRSKQNYSRANVFIYHTFKIGKCTIKEKGSVICVMNFSGISQTHLVQLNLTMAVEINDLKTTISSLLNQSRFAQSRVVNLKIRPITITSAKLNETEQMPYSLLHVWGASHDFCRGMRRRKKSLVRNPATRRRQQAWQLIANCVNTQVVQGTSRYDANYTCESHEINVLHESCMCDNDSLTLQPLRDNENLGAGKK